METRRLEVIPQSPFAFEHILTSLRISAGTVLEVVTDDLDRDVARAGPLDPIDHPSVRRRFFRLAAGLLCTHRYGAR